MAERTLNVALRIRADLGNAASNVAEVDAAVDSLGSSAKQSSTGLNALANASDAAATAMKTEAAAASSAATAQQNHAQATKTGETATRSSTTAHRQHATAVKADATAVTDLERRASRAGISVGQYSMAMRMLPAQMTDIGVGLATGQSPFMVMMQQGGQLKDMFGGIVPAAKAVGSSVLGLVNPYTIAAGAVAGLGAALIKHQNEVAGYNQALIATGGYAGRMVTQLQAAADAMEDVGHGDATEALTEVAASGRFAGEAFDLVSEAAARMKASVDREVDATITAFTAIQNDPVKALLKLNETEHFLTQAQLDRVQAMVAEGREQDAVSEATRIYHDHLIDVANAAEAARTPLERLWAEAKRGASDATAEVANFTNLLATAAVQAQEQAAAKPWYQRGLTALIPPVFRGYSALSAATPETPAEMPTGAAQAVVSKKAQAVLDEAAKKEREREQERKSFQAAEVRYLNDTAKKRKEIADVNDMVTRGVISQADATTRIGLIEADYAERAKKHGAQKKTDAQQEEESGRRELQNLQRQIAMLDAIGEGQKRASEESRMRWETEHGNHVRKSAALKAELIEAAKVLDLRNAERAAEEERRQEIEKTKRAYEQMVDALRKPAEVAVDLAIERLKLLNSALDAGIAKAPDYNQQVGRIITGAFTKAPTLNGLSPEVGGVSSEQYRLDQQKEAVETRYQDQMSRLAAFRQQRSDLNAQWDEQELLVAQEHAAALATLSTFQNQLMLTQAAGAFDSLAGMAKAWGGEQSRTYRVLFAISKGFAVAQAAVALAQNVAEASKTGYPENIPKIIGALAQGAQIASLLSAAQYATGGRITGPGTGTSDSVPIWASDGEYMVRHASANQPGAMAFLEDFNQRGMAAVGDWRGYADGGRITASPEPRGQYGASSGRATSVSNSMRLYNLFDLDALAQAVANHPATEKSVINIASQNGQAIRAEWGG